MGFVTGHRIGLDWIGQGEQGDSGKYLEACSHVLSSDAAVRVSTKLGAELQARAENASAPLAGMSHQTLGIYGARALEVV